MTASIRRSQTPALRQRFQRGVHAAGRSRRDRLHNKTTVYTILFKVAAETLRTIAADPRHLGAEIGLIAVLHSWGQTLTYHPHLHCIVPGGGVSPEGTRWISCRVGFFLPVRVLSRPFHRRFLEKLRVAHDAGQLGFFGDLAHLAKPDALARLLAEIRRLEWVVCAKPPFGGLQQVLAYGRYNCVEACIVAMSLDC